MKGYLSVFQHTQILRSFAYHNFRLYWAGQFISLFGSWMQIVALNWLTYQLTNSPLALGVINFVALLPVGLLALAGGAISDKFPRRNLILITETVLALSSLLLAVLTGLGITEIWHVIIITFLVGAANALGQPARFIFLMDIVGKEDFTNAVGLNVAVANLARVFSPVLAGTLIGWFGETSCFALNCVSYLAVILAFLWMRLPTRFDVQEPLRLGSEVAGGLKYIWQNVTIRSLVILIAVLSLLAQPVSMLMPALARDVLWAGSLGYGQLMSAMGGGAVCGSLVAGTIRAGHRGKWLVVSSLTFPAFLLLFAISRWLPASLVWLFLAAMSQFVFVVLINSLMQLAAGEKFQGRVASFFVLLNNGLNRLGSMPMGAVAQIWGPSVAVLSGAALSLIGVLVVIKWMPTVRRLE